MSVIRAAIARDGMDLNSLTGRLAGVVRETMQPETVTVWLKLRNGSAAGPEAAL
jgi:hypothetical protein